MYLHKKDKLELLTYFYNMINKLIIDYNEIYNEADYDYEYVN